MELLVAKDVMEKHRQHKDGAKPMVHQQPVLIVEALQAQIQRRMAVFRTAELTDDPAEILDDISYQIKHQKRPDRGNLNQIQLLSLSPAQRIQKQYVPRPDGHDSSFPKTTPSG